MLHALALAGSAILLTLAAYIFVGDIRRNLPAIMRALGLERRP